MHKNIISGHGTSIQPYLCLDWLEELKLLVIRIVWHCESDSRILEHHANANSRDL